MKKFSTFGTMHTFFEGEKLLGRLVANEGFFKTLFTIDPFDEYFFFLDNPKAFKEKIQDLPWSAIKRNAVKVLPAQNLIEEIQQREFTCFHFLDPYDNQTRVAYIRNKFSKNIFPITSVPHTLSYTGLSQDFLHEIWPGVSPRDVICATSQAAIDVIQEYFSQLRTNYALPSDWKTPNFRLLPLGVDIQKFTPKTKEQKDLARKKLDIQPDEIICLTHGRIRADDKMDLLPLLYAAKRILSEENPPNIHLIVSGSINKNDSYPKVLKAQAEALKIPFTLVDTPDDDQLQDLYTAADIFVSPSDNIQETFGLTILEAQASGLPVVASDWDGYRDLIRNEKTGYRIPTLYPDSTPYLNTITPILPENIHQLYIAEQTAIDVPKLAEAIKKLANTPALREEFGKNGRKFVAEHFSWNHIIDQWLALIDELRSIPIDEALTAQLRNAFHPVYLDYAKIFKNHPTKTFNAATFSNYTFALSKRGKDVLAQKDVSIYWPALKSFMPDSDIRRILTYARRPISGDKLIAKLARVSSEEMAQFAVLWSLKHDLIEQKMSN